MPETFEAPAVHDPREVPETFEAPAVHDPREAELVRLATELAEVRAHLVIAENERDEARKAQTAAVNRDTAAEAERDQARAERDRVVAAHGVFERHELPLVDPENPGPITETREPIDALIYDALRKQGGVYA